MRKQYYSLIATALLLTSAISTRVAGQSNTATIPQPISVADLRIRDPFILADQKSQTYYLYRQIANGRGDTTQGIRGVEVYQSKDLKIWTGPQTVFKQPEDFWANNEVWAPEVHSFQGKYYLFVTFSAADSIKNKEKQPGPKVPIRGTQILVSNNPAGPFKIFENKAYTPAEWSSLDGTLWVEDNVPWMVFCHEWTQITDGTMELLQLKPNLSAPIGVPRLLFRASEAPWGKNMRDLGYKHSGFVTDGPFLYKTKTGKLLMIWSSFGSENYAVGIAESASGKVNGPWIQQPEPLFRSDGGHAMIFKTFQGQLMLCLHQPNQHLKERMQIFTLEDTGTTLKVSSIVIQN